MSLFAEAVSSFGEQRNQCKNTSSIMRMFDIRLIVAGKELLRCKMQGRRYLYDTDVGHFVNLVDL